MPPTLSKLLAWHCAVCGTGCAGPTDYATMPALITAHTASCAGTMALASQGKVSNPGAQHFLFAAERAVAPGEQESDDSEPDEDALVMDLEQVSLLRCYNGHGA